MPSKTFKKTDNNAEIIYDGRLYSYKVLPKHEPYNKEAAKAERNTIQDALLKKARKFARLNEKDAYELAGKLILAEKKKTLLHETGSRRVTVTLKRDYPEAFTATETEVKSEILSVRTLIAKCDRLGLITW